MLGLARDCVVARVLQYTQLPPKTNVPGRSTAFMKDGPQLPVTRRCPQKRSEPIALLDFGNLLAKAIGLKLASPAGRAG